MGRLLQALLSELQTVPSANPANFANLSGGEAHKFADSQDSQGVCDDMRNRLLMLADREGIDRAHVDGLEDADLQAIPSDYAERNLVAYLRALVASSEMDSGLIPASWGGRQVANCSGCGDVWLWPGAPSRAVACLWCFRRKAGKAIPRPDKSGG